MSDEEILAEFAAERLRVDTVTLAVYKLHPSKGWIRLTEREHYRSGRISFNLRTGQYGTREYRQRTVYRNRLVYLWEHRRLVPLGHDIDHKNGINTDDNPDNLRVRDSYENACDNIAVGMRECSEYFELVAMGIDPS